MTASPPYDLLIAGGGPAGLAAAAQAAAAGLRTVIVDERVTLGGQIYKRMGPGFTVRDPAAIGPDYVRGQTLIDAAVAGGAELLLSTNVLAIEGERVIVQTGDEPARELTARRRLLAPGAHDRPVAFPGWTLPGGADRGRRADAGQDPRGAARRADPVRRLGPAGDRVPRPADRLRRERRAHHRRRPRAPAPPTSCGCSPPPAATCSCCATRCTTAPRCCGRGSGCATAGSSSTPRARAGSSRSPTPRSTAPGARCRAPRRRSRSTPCASDTASSPRSN